MTPSLRQVRLGTRVTCTCGCKAEGRFLSSDGKNVEIVWITNSEGEPCLAIEKHEITDITRIRPEVVH